MYSVVGCSLSVGINDLRLLDGTVEFNYVLTDFLLVNLSISDRGSLKSLTIIVDSSFFSCIL